MNKPTNVLIIENENLIVDAIKKAFLEVSKTSHLKFIFTFFENSDLALCHLNETKNKKTFDLIVLNINITKPDSEEFLFTEDICQEFQKIYPEIKIILLASSRDNFRINRIFKTINPESILIKSDINFEKLVFAITSILEGTPFYCKRILDLIRKRITNDIHVDKINVLILYHLSKGIRTKDLTDLVPLTIGGIERRKRSLKEIFNVSESGDEILILKARERGFI